MAAGVNLGKTNMAITSGPGPRVFLGKTNMAVTSHPSDGTILVGKTNMAVVSDPTPVLPPRRRTQFLNESG